MSRFSTYTAQRKTAEAMVTLAELQSRATAAARMSMRGNGFDAEDRADTAAELVWRVLDTNTPKGHGRPADVLAWTDTAAHLHAGRVPASWATFSRLFGMAANLRRSLERERERDTAEALRAASAGLTFEAFTPAPALETGGTPTGARRSAVEMLRALGMMDTAKRHGRTVEVAPTGPIWTLAYTAARSAGTLDAEALAEELELERATLRQHLSRAPKRIPAAQAELPLHLWTEALHMPDTATALKPSRSRTLSADMGTRENGPREHLPRAQHAPCTSRTDRRIIRKAPRGSDWGKALETGTTAEARTAKRLAAAAAIRVERVNARTAAERDHLRLAAGVTN